MTDSEKAVFGVACFAWGDSAEEMCISLATLFLYRADPRTSDRILELLEEDGFPVVKHQAMADGRATMLRSLLKEAEGMRE